MTSPHSMDRRSQMLTMDELRVASHYRAKAEEMRLSAKFEAGEEAMLLNEIADRFDRLGDQALKRLQASIVAERA